MRGVRALDAFLKAVFAAKADGEARKARWLLFGEWEGDPDGEREHEGEAVVMRCGTIGPGPPAAVSERKEEEFPWTEPDLLSNVRGERDQTC